GRVGRNGVFERIVRRIGGVDRRFPRRHLEPARSPQHRAVESVGRGRAREHQKNRQERQPTHGSRFANARGAGLARVRSSSINLNKPFRLYFVSATTLLRSTPIFEISTSTASPGLSHSGGLRAMPTPGGVPVEITSPGTSGVKADT